VNSEVEHTTKKLYNLLDVFKEGRKEQDIDLGKVLCLSSAISLEDSNLFAQDIAFCMILIVHNNIVKQECGAKWVPSFLCSFPLCTG
jgi:hypothetical protein